MSQSVAAAIPSSPSTTSSQPASLPGSVAIPPNNVPQEPTKCNNPQQPPITFKAIKLKYDTGCDENKKELKKECTTTSSQQQIKQPVTITSEKIINQTVTVMQPVRITSTLPPNIITQIKMSPPQTVYQKMEPVTVTKMGEPVTVTLQGEVRTVTENKTIEAKKEPQPVKKEECNEEVVTVDKVINVPDNTQTRGIECVPACECEDGNNCDNPCEEIKCQIL